MCLLLVIFIAFEIWPDPDEPYSLDLGADCIMCFYFCSFTECCAPRSFKLGIKAKSIFPFTSMPSMDLTSPRIRLSD